MKCDISLGIGGVDGETGVNITTPLVAAVRKFLKENDHEGSFVSMSVKVYDEDAYTLLEALEKLESLS